MSHVWLDVAIVATFFLGGALLARSVLLVQPRPVFFYEMFISAAVLDACGLGFHEYRGRAHASGPG